MKILTTERLGLREFEMADAAFMLRLLNDEGWKKNIGDKNICDLAGAVNFIEQKICPSYEEHGFGLYLVYLLDRNEPIGMCGLVSREGLDAPDVGFAIIQEYCGHGYATEAAQSILDFAKEQLDLEVVVGITSETNEASARVLEKIGLKYKKLVNVPGYDLPSRYFA